MSLESREISKNPELNSALKNHLEKQFTSDFINSDSFEKFRLEILRLLTIIKAAYKDELDPDNEMKELINEILGDYQNNIDLQKMAILLGNLRVFAGENYNTRDFLNL